MINMATKPDHIKQIQMAKLRHMINTEIKLVALDKTSIFNSK